MTAVAPRRIVNDISFGTRINHENQFGERHSIW